VSHKNQNSQPELFSF